MKKNKRKLENIFERMFIVCCIVAISLPIVLLFTLIAKLILQGMPRIDLNFLLSYPSRKAELAGVLPSVVGTLYLMFLTALLAFPLGIGAALYLEEYAKKNRISKLIELNIGNLAGIPSVIYGLLGLGLFVRTLGMGRSLIAGACTLTLLVLPIIITTSREALRTVPNTMREASLALGATRLSTILHVVLPQALPGLMTCFILALSRAIGETAPLVAVGALSYVTFLPDGIDAPFGALPIQIFNWVSRPQPEFLVNASAAIITLLTMILILNSVAIIIRDRTKYRY